MRCNSYFTKNDLFTATQQYARRTYVDGVRACVCAGPHLIKLGWSDFALHNSPFHGVCRSLQKQVNHEKVILTGRGLKEARLREDAEFVIDGTEAGPGASCFREVVLRHILCHVLQCVVICEFLL